MTTTQPIKTLFANDIHRRIEEVIKVDQTDEEIIRDEIDEYVVTDAIRSHYTEHLRGLSRDAEQAARGHRDLGLGLLRLRQVELREDARSLDREPRRRRRVRGRALRPARRRQEAPGAAQGHHREDSRRTPSSSTSRPTAASAAATRRSPRSCTGSSCRASATRRTSTSPSWRSRSRRRGSSRASRTSTSASSRRTGPPRRARSPSRSARRAGCCTASIPTTYPMADSWVKAVKNKADITPGQARRARQRADEAPAARAAR